MQQKCCVLKSKVVYLGMFNTEEEKYLDKKLCKRLKDQGGWGLKMVTSHITGLPDRLCLLPGGTCFFAEIKTTGKKPRKIQLHMHKRLRALGFKVYVVDTTESINQIFIDYGQGNISTI